MVDRLLNMALVGGEPILYLLIALSFLSIAVVIERLIIYARNRIDLGSFSNTIIRLLNERRLEEATQTAENLKAAQSMVILEGLKNYDCGKSVVKELMDSKTMSITQRFDKRLSILGTIGSNAPFIGLLGTVLGIVKAFNDLAMNTEGGPAVVMGGIAEALVATAVGLLVAIPAVVFFNYFKNRQKSILMEIEQLKSMLLAFIGEDNHGDGQAPLNKAA